MSSGPIRQPYRCLLFAKAKQSEHCLDQIAADLGKYLISLDCHKNPLDKSRLCLALTEEVQTAIAATSQTSKPETIEHQAQISQSAT